MCRVIYVPACTPPRDSILGSHDRKLRDVPVIAASKVVRSSTRHRHHSGTAPSAQLAELFTVVGLATHATGSFVVAIKN